MFKHTSISFLVFLPTLFYLTGCGSSKVDQIKDDYYKAGINDGCTTAKGNYKKSHKRFNTYTDYKDGWFLGRNRCKHLLVVDEKEISSSR